MQQWPSKSFLVPHTKSKKWSAFIILYVIEGAVVWPALRNIARLFFLLCACKGKWEGESNRKGVWDTLIFSWHVPRQPSSSHHAALMATQLNRGEFPSGGKEIKRKIWSLHQQFITLVTTGSAEAALWDYGTMTWSNSCGPKFSGEEEEGGITAPAAGAKREGGTVKGLWVTAGNCCGWLGTNTLPVSSKRAPKPVPGLS